MTHEVQCAGFGGQGVLLIGRLITYAGMVDGKQVSWMPAYGPEMRGGTASCAVIIAKEAIGSPLVNNPSALVAMNKPSLDRFGPTVRPGGVIVINKSLITDPELRSDVKSYHAPLNELAEASGGPRYANMVALGVLIGATDLVPLSAIETTMTKNFAAKPELVAANLKAVLSGIEFAKQQ